MVAILPSMGQFRHTSDIISDLHHLHWRYSQPPRCSRNNTHTSHSATMVTPFLANKGFHPKLKVSLESVGLDAAHLVTSYLKELHQYLHNQISCALKQY